MENKKIKKSIKKQKQKSQNNIIGSNKEKTDNDISEESISNDDIQTDNNWSKFQLNTKLSSNLSKIFPEPIPKN